MAYDDQWWLTDDHPDAEEHRKFIEREAKAAAERTLAIFPTIRKTASNAGVVTRKEFDRALFEAGKAMAGELRKRDERIAELEARPAGLDYRGTYAPGTYARNAGVTHQGSIWVAVKDKPTKEPGTANSGWQLACKRGRDGKDMK